MVPPARPVLVVEDDDGLRALVDLLLDDTALHDSGPLRAVCVRDAAAAWRALGSVTPAVVVLDLLLPGEEDGLTFCRRLRADPRLAPVPVVAVSAAAPTLEWASRARAAGCDAFLPKPFDLDDLIAALRTYLVDPATTSS